MSPASPARHAAELADVAISRLASSVRGAVARHRDTLSVCRRMRSCLLAVLICLAVAAGGTFKMEKKVAPVHEIRSQAYWISTSLGVSIVLEVAVSGNAG